MKWAYPLPQRQLWAVMEEKLKAREAEGCDEGETKGCDAETKGCYRGETVGCDGGQGCDGGEAEGMSGVQLPAAVFTFTTMSTTAQRGP